MCWEFGDDGTGFYQRLATKDRPKDELTEFGSCLLVFEEELE
jgi:hypothetical protein